ncbi:MAG: DUF3524 domain-containing protein [Phycisphaerales bacterium]|nr:MAG: DUF3524 domain-containing protein [Phycisphaerales bacterium]
MSTADENAASARKVLVVEPYYGGSHRAFLDALQAHSRHEFRLLTLPARKWKWRMRGAAIWFADELSHRPAMNTDLILTSDMLSVADLRALLPETYRNVPIACYFHENQLTYPLSEADRRDYQFGFTNLTSCLAADAVWFNSAFHRDGFLSAAGRLLTRMPDFVPTGSLDAIAAKAEVHWPPVSAPPEPLDVEPRARWPITILWSHRWEYDKNPEEFFETLFRLNDAGGEFRLVLVGESFRDGPDVFRRAGERLQDKIAHCGYLEDRRDYWRWLAAADVIVSTAIQENFGISVVEALLAGCWPILPDRLSYAEILPPGARQACLYRDADHLLALLSRCAADGIDPVRSRRLMHEARWLHDTGRRAADLDDAICAAAAGG